MATSTASEGIGSRLVMADLSGMGFEHPHSRDALTRPWPPRAARACCLKAARAALLTAFLSSFPRCYGSQFNMTQIFSQRSNGMTQILIYQLLYVYCLTMCGPAARNTAGPK